jgi:hypothetical protein
MKRPLVTERRSFYRSIPNSSSIWARASSSIFVLLLASIVLAAEDGDWARRTSDGVTLIVPPSDQAGATALLDTLVVLRSEVAALLGEVLVPDVEVYVVRSDQDFRTLTRNRIPHWGVGVAYPQAKTIVLKRRAGQTESLRQTARHEFSHILLHHVLSATENRIPVWFNEGVAMWVAHEWRLQQSFEVGVAALGDGLIPLSEVDAVLDFGEARAHLAYDQSYLAVVFIVARAGEGAIEDLIRSLRDGVAFNVALYRITGLSPEAFENAFAAFVENRFGLRSLVTSDEAIWLYIVVLVLLVWVGVRMKNRRTIARWEDEDPLEGLPLRLRAKINRERER